MTVHYQNIKAIKLDDAGDGQVMKIMAWKSESAFIFTGLGSHYKAFLPSQKLHILLKIVI